MNEHRKKLFWEQFCNLLTPPDYIGQNIHTSYGYHIGGPEDDAKALAQDWQNVGNDMRAALRKIEIFNT